MVQKKRGWAEAEKIAYMLLGCVCYALGLVLFLSPFSIVAGGVTGLAILLNTLFSNLPLGLLTIALNIPILLLGIRYCGVRFILKCLLTISVLGVCTDLLALLPPVTDNSILAALYGGILQGTGIGFFMRSEYSSGGTELLGRVISKLTGHVLRLPICIGILDGIIVVLGAVFTKNPDNMLYALIVIFMSTKVSELVLMGLGKSKLCIIITDHGEEVSKALLERSPRGITMLDGRGMYTKRDRNVLLTCIKSRQLPQLKQIVKEIDETAFIIVNDSVEVRGKGFRALGED